MRLHLLLVAILFTSCATLNSIHLDNERYAKSSPADVKIFLLKEDLPSSYTKLGVIYANNLFPEKRMERVRKAASEMGANGLYFEPNRVISDSLGVPIRIEVANTLSKQTEFIAIKY